MAGQVLATRHFGTYCRWMGNVVPATHHQLLISKLEAVERGEIQRLMVFMPPGHAKSTYSSILFPAWYVGRNPTNTIITASYSSTLSERFGRKVRDQVGSPYYPFAGVTLSEKTKSRGEWETNKGGEYFAAGVGSGITGRRANLGLIDDPIKGREDADSEVIREKTWEWYLSDFRTRLKPDAPIVLIQTRWHEDDLAGRILPEDYDFRSGQITARDGEIWEVISLPALAEESDYLGRKPGEALWPELYSREKLEQERTSQGLRNWISLYQQRPSPETGAFFKREWVKYYDTPPAHLHIYGASDYAVTSKGGDFTEHGVIGIDPNADIYFLDWWYGQEETDIWIEQLLDLMHKWKPLQWQSEKGQITKSVGPFIQRRMREKEIYCYINEITPTVDKVTRAQSFRGRMAQGKVYFPKTEWADRVIKQLLAFPSGRYDDAVDVCSLFGLMLALMSDAELPVEPIEKTQQNDVWMQPQIDRQNDKRVFW